MNARSIVAVVAGAAVATTVGVTDTPRAVADPATAEFGTALEVAGGAYTVDDLQPSATDELNVPLTGNVPIAGTLWRARARVNAVRGAVVPAMQFFNARTTDGHNYRVLVQTFAPDLEISPLAQGATSDGMIYFDVTGPAPTEVVFDDGQSRLVWAG